MQPGASPATMEIPVIDSPARESGPPFTSAVILGGLGEVGALYSRSLAACGIAVRDVDRRPRRGGRGTRGFLRSDATAPDRALLQVISAADCVIVCLPEDAALAAIGGIVGAMRQGALWVDTLSVKTAVCRAFGERAQDVEVLSINPMFAPALGWRGHAVAAVELAAGPRSAAMIGLLESWGARVERVGAEAHDALTAAIQVATHAAVLAFGSALRELGYKTDPGLRLATPPHQLMLALLSRIVDANPAVYAEIQRCHPQGEAVRQAMRRALATVSAGAQDPAADAMHRLFEELRLLLSPAQSQLRDLSDRVIALAAGRRVDIAP